MQFWLSHAAHRGSNGDADDVAAAGRNRGNYRIFLLSVGFYFYAFSCYSEAAQSCLDSRQRPGQCVLLARCPQLIEDFFDETKAQATSGDFQTFVGESICGFDGRSFLVCCFSPSSPSETMSDSGFQPTRRPARFLSTTTMRSAFDLSFGSLFQFAPLSALSTGSPVLFTYPPPANSPNGNPPPVIFQQIPDTNTPNMVLPTPNYGQSTSTIFQPTPPPSQTSTIFQPTPPPVIISPVPTNFPPNVQQPAQPGGLPVAGQCGISYGSTNRVVGGSEAKKGAYPWMAALGYYDDQNRNSLKFLCAGSLITQRHILTSAHCITSSLAMARLGAHDLSKPLEPNAIDLRIKQTIVHEAFDIRAIANDVAIIELNTPAPITNFIAPICLPDGNNFLTQDFIGMNPFIAGWGAIKHQGPTSNVLRDAQVPIVNRQTCEQSYKTVFRFIEFSNKLICAGNSNVDACQGDSGGPLMLPYQTNGSNFRYVLLGIVSYGYECARSGFPGVYTRVAAYVPWIRARIV